MNEPTRKILMSRLSQAIQEMSRLTMGEVGIKLGPHVCYRLSQISGSLSLAHSHLSGKIVRGECRICGCTTAHACDPPCSWADGSHTLCTNPACLALAKNPSLEEIHVELLRAAECVLAGLKERMDAADGRSVPVFEGIAELHAAIGRAGGKQ